MSPLQVYQSQLFQVLVIASPLRGTEGTLTTPTQMTYKTGSNIPVYFAKRLARITKTKVVSPPTLLAINDLDQLRHRNQTLATANRSAKPIPVRLHRLARWGYVKIPVSATPEVSIVPKRKSQKIYTRSGLPEIDDLCLGSVQLQTQPGFNLGLDKAGQPITLVARENHKVSSPGESHPQALSEPGVNLSAHRAPIIQPTAKSPFASGRKAGVHDKRSDPANVPLGVYGN